MKRDKIGQTDLVTKSSLKARGWTDKLIATFLPYPHTVKSNPKYKSASPMLLYEIKSIIAMESTDEFRRLREKLLRNNNAKKGVQTKRKKIIKYVESLEIRLPELTKDRLIENACFHYNNLHFLSIDKDAREEDDNWEFLSRICCNYLRHECTDYEIELNKLFGKVGKGEAYKVLKQKINDAIDAKYLLICGCATD